MSEFGSEPIKPRKGTFDPGPMAAGLPGLPSAFDWGDETFQVIELREA